MRAREIENATIDNHHTVNSLKRLINELINIMPIRLKPKNYPSSNHSSPLLNCSMNLLVIFTLILNSGNFLAIDCDYLPSSNGSGAGATVCPRELSSQIYPCTCQNGTQALLIKCQRLNLASLSSSLGNLNSQELQVELLEISDSSITKLFGPLFNDSNQHRFHRTLKQLDLKNCQLKSIDSRAFSIELQNNLEYLQLDRNQLIQVPNVELLNNLTNLKLLNLSQNSIQSIELNSFYKLNSLLELDLSFNQISKLNGKGSFNSLINLEYLNLNGNDLIKLDKNLFNSNKKLKFLDLSNNKLTNLDRQDFNELTSLETLNLKNNLLTTIPRSIFSRNAKLYHLDLAQNKLEDIDTYLFKSVRFLKHLNISGNLIKEITKNTFSPTTRLKSVDLSSNLLSSLQPETFKNLEWLETIDLAHNQIVNISNDAFNKIDSVEIDLSFNKLTRIFYWSFHEVNLIKKLNLSHNLLDDGISPIAFESTDCAHLDLSYNFIQDISKIPLSNLTGLKVLNLAHNQITEFNKKSFTQKSIPLYELHTIDASFNNISQITGNILEKLRSIRNLNLSFNSLRRLTSGALGNSPTLLELNLSHNNLVEVVSGTLVGLISLKDLNISFNRLKKMIPIPVALNSIHLEYNDISQLSRSAFPSLNSLLELYLDHNRLMSIEEGTFATLLSLNTLSLSYNNISTIPAQALRDLLSLQALSLDGNNIQKLHRKAFGVLPIVFHLKLDHNNISSIADHSFDGLLQLLTLNLSFNNLNELPAEAFKSLVSLQVLDLSNNHLTRFENKSKSVMEDLLSLEVANFTNNKLSTITGKTFLSSPYIPYKLKHLDLSNNLIGIIANNFANGLKKVEWLSLRNNIINEIYPNVLTNASHLRYLDLSNNKLRLIKDNTFGGGSNGEFFSSTGNNNFINLTTLSLANNKLSSIEPREFEKLKNLIDFDLSGNRLETFHLDYARWLKQRGMLLDLSRNQLECNCDLLPLAAWLDSFKFRYEAQAAALPPVNLNNLDKLTAGRHHQPLTQKLLGQYLQATQLMSTITCSRKDLPGAPRALPRLIDFAINQSAPPASGSANLNELNCDSMYLNEVDSLMRLKAPIQFTGAEAYYYDNEQYIKIAWTLVNQQVDLLNFLIVKARFKQSFELSAHRTLKYASQSSKSLSDYQLIDQTVDKLTYDRRTHLLRNLDLNSFYVICIAYESSHSNDPASISSNSNYPALIEQASWNGSVNLQASFAGILSDYTRINCVDMNSLLRQDYSERLVTSSSHPAILVGISQLSFVLITTTTIGLILTIHQSTLGSGKTR